MALVFVVMIGCLAAMWVGGMPTPAPAAQQAAALATVSGAVDSASTFKAAQVYIRNVDKRILYMVYTNGGQFRAVSLFPGNYEVNVRAKGLESDVQKIALKGGENPKLKLSLRAAKANASTPEELTYDAVYPPGPGRDVAERTCVVCHGENFIPTRPATEAVWKARLDRMMGTFLPERPAASYAEGLLSYRNTALGFSRKDRDDLMAYLVKNFGPDAKPRAVRVDQEMPVDERNSAGRCTSSITFRRILRAKVSMRPSTTNWRRVLSEGEQARMCVSTMTAMCGSRIAVIRIGW